MPITDQQRARTLERFEAHRRAWRSNPALRELYAEWYARVAAELPPATLGPRVELGSGPGFAREFIADLELTDLVLAPWHDREASALALPYADGALGALVLFDVLHHLPSPGRFFEEAIRVLRPGGRIVLCEPYVGPLSYPIYKLFHDEPLRLWVDPLVDRAGGDPTNGNVPDPFDANQAIPTLLFGPRRRAFARAFPALRLRRLERLAGPSYPASGGFSRGALLPGPLWSALRRWERRLPEPLFRILGFRLLAVIERV